MSFIKYVESKSSSLLSSSLDSINEKFVKLETNLFSVSFCYRFDSFIRPATTICSLAANFIKLNKLLPWIWLKE